MATQGDFEQLTQKIKEAVVESLSFPPKEELIFLEKQPGTQQLVKKANLQLISLISDLSTFVLGKNLIPKSQLTLPYKSIEPVLDDILLRVGIQLDKLEGAEPEESQGFQTVTNTKNNLHKIEDAQPLKPPDIYGFRHIIEQNHGPYPFIPLIKEKLFLINELPQELKDAQKDSASFFRQLEEAGHDISEYDFTHPYEQEIQELELPAESVDPKEQIQSITALGRATYVHDVEGLIEMIESIEMLVNINGRTEIAVDLEHFHQRSYLGVTCLIQISTRGLKDYLVDPFPLWSELHVLGRIMHNPKIIKVLHGADSDVQWLQRDFGVYIVGLFDTYQASRLLQLPTRSYAYLLEYYCLKHTDKTFQLADWTTRPLTEDMMKYAQIDTHYLLYIYDRIRIDLYNLAVQNNIQPPSAYILSAFQNSKDTSMRIFRKPSLRADIMLDNILFRAQKTLDPERYQLTVQLLQWREEISRKNDENAKLVLPNHALFKILDVKPTKSSELYNAIGGERTVHFIVKNHHSDIIRICMADSIKLLIPSQKLPLQKQITNLTKSAKIDQLAQVDQLEEKILYEYINYNYVPLEIELSKYEYSKTSKTFTFQKKGTKPPKDTLKKCFIFSNSLEAFQNTQIGQILIQNLSNSKLNNNQTLKNTTMLEEGNSIVEQPLTDEYIAFPKEIGEKPAQKKQIRLYDDTPKSLESQYGTSVNKKRKGKTQNQENNISKQSNASFNVFNKLQK